MEKENLLRMDGRKDIKGSVRGFADLKRQLCRFVWYYQIGLFWYQNFEKNCPLQISVWSELPDKNQLIYIIGRGDTLKNNLDYSVLLL